MVGFDVKYQTESAINGPFLRLFLQFTRLYGPFPALEIDWLAMGTLPVYCSIVSINKFESIACSVFHLHVGEGLFQSDF